MKETHFLIEAQLFHHKFKLSFLEWDCVI